MADTNKQTNDMVGGEVSPLTYGQSNSPQFAKAMKQMLNFVALPQGASRLRNGSIMVKNANLNNTGVLIPYVFNPSQAFICEFSSNGFIRFYTDASDNETGGVVLNTAKSIATVTAASPPTVNCPGHGFANGTEVYIQGVVGMPEVNNQFFLINVVDLNNFTLSNIDGSNVNTAFAPTSGTEGTVASVYQITHPYAAADLHNVQFAQAVDALRFVHQRYPPQKLICVSNTDWTFGTYARTNDPFTGAGAYPGSICFDITGRCIMGGTLNQPNALWGSEEPTTASGVLNYDVFTIGTNDTNGFVFVLAPVQGKTDAILWLGNNANYLAIGCFGGFYTVYGAAIGSGITPTAINAPCASNRGAAPVLPMSDGLTLMYVQRGGLVLNSVVYDFYNSQYVDTNETTLADHLTAPSSLIRIIEQQGAQSAGVPDCIWCLRADGVLLGLTYARTPAIAAWHHHTIGGFSQNAALNTIPRAKVLSIASLPRPTGVDQIWMLVERFINNKTIRTIEYIEDQPIYPLRQDYWTGNQEADDTNFANYLFEVQKTAVHMDMAVQYNGNQYGLAVAAALVPDVVSGPVINLISVTVGGTTLAPVYTPNPVFTPQMVGQQIWKAYDVNGGGGGRVLVTQFISSTHVICEGLSDFDKVNPMLAGAWYVTTTQLYGLPQLEGNTVQVCADGGAHPDCVVFQGGVTLDAPASVVSAGFFSTGILSTLNQDSGGITGPAEAKTREVYRAMVRYANTLGAAFGTTEYNTEELSFRENQSAQLDRPPQLVNGIKRYDYMLDNPDMFDKRGVIIQKYPLPCTVLSIDLFMVTSDE